MRAVPKLARTLEESRDTRKPAARKVITSHSLLFDINSAAHFSECEFSSLHARDARTRVQGHRLHGLHSHACASAHNQPRSTSACNAAAGANASNRSARIAVCARRE